MNKGLARMRVKESKLDNTTKRLPKVLIAVVLTLSLSLTLSLTPHPLTRYPVTSHPPFSSWIRLQALRA